METLIERREDASTVDVHPDPKTVKFASGKKQKKGKTGSGHDDGKTDSPEEAATLAEIPATLFEKAPTLAEKAPTLAEKAPSLADRGTLAEKAPTLDEKAPLPNERLGDPNKESKSRSVTAVEDRGDSSVSPRVDRLRKASSAVFEEAAYDPSFRFVLVAALLFIVFLAIVLMSKLIG